MTDAHARLSAMNSREFMSRLIDALETARCESKTCALEGCTNLIAHGKYCSGCLRLKKAECERARRKRLKDARQAS